MYENQQYCVHCNSYISSDIKDLIEHCKSCSHMTRPDAFHFKFVCYACEYNTYMSGNIKTHLRLHLDDKPYKCSLCNYECRQNVHLKSHMKSNH